MRFHVLGLPHTVSGDEYNACAFTQKVVKFCKMMHSRGHHVIHYGHERSSVECSEQVSVTSDHVLRASYGDYDWRSKFFKHSSDDIAHQVFTRNCIREVGLRKLPGDFLLCFWGVGHKEIADNHRDMLAVEPGIGYPETFAQFRVFESYAVLHGLMGKDAVSHCGHMKWYDAVIPNYFDPDEFAYNESKEDYVLYLGRVYEGKGVNVAIEATALAGKVLKIAGQGSIEEMGYSETPSHVEFLGYADKDSRKELMSKASCLIIASQYNEPFGGVMVEAMMSGTPVVTVDWGAATEIVKHGITGFRCRTMDHFVWALRNVSTISSKECRDWSVKNYSLERVATMYEEYFEMLTDVKFKKGWYEIHENRDNLNWLKKE